MIQKAPGTNAWIQTDQSVSTPSEVLSVAITRYHHDVITIGRDALDRFDARERDIRSVTMGLSPEAYRAAKDRLETFWKELLAYCAGQSSPSRVYQLNLQLFPLSKKQRGNR